MAQEIVAMSFANTTRADEVLLSLAHRQQEGLIQIADAVVIAKDADGRARVRETMDTTPAKGAMSGTWWGLLAGLLLGNPLVGMVGGVAAGALMGKLVDLGLDDSWVKQMAGWIDPGTSALLLLVEDTVHHAVIDELARFEGNVVYTTLPDGVREALQEALADDR
jgi:uncharacterized membrane protein